jgi:ubiquitin carboxyl-terminal hydrolase 8
MEIDNYINKKNEFNKRSGLQNIGATCYINTIIQCLLSCEPFRKFILSNDYMDRLKSTDSLDSLDDKNNYYLVKELESIFRSMWVDGNSLNPLRFLKFLKIKFDFIDINTQNDIHEILLLILNKINEEIKVDNYTELLKNKQDINFKTEYDKLKYVCNEKWIELNKNEYSELNELLYNHSISQIVCGNCNYIHHNHESSCVIDLEIPKNEVDLKTCFINYLGKDKLNIDDENKWKCDECGTSNESDKIIKYWDLPQVLIISLKRFFYDKNTNRMSKNNSIVNIPFNLDLSDCVIQDKEYNYKLQSVGIHLGNIYGGHYVSLVRKNNEDKIWTIIDDLSIRDIEEKDFNLNNAYMLFYTKI